MAWSHPHVDLGEFASILHRLAFLCFGFFFEGFFDLFYRGPVSYCGYPYGVQSTRHVSRLPGTGLPSRAMAAATYVVVQSKATPGDLLILQVSRMYSHRTRLSYLTTRIMGGLKRAYFSLAILVFLFFSFFFPFFSFLFSALGHRVFATATNVLHMYLLLLCMYQDRYLDRSGGQTS